MRVLVTGSTGFVGRWMVRELISSGHELAGRPDDRVDVTDGEAVAALFRSARPDGVIHLAGIAFAPAAARDPAAAERVNVGGTVEVLRAMRQLGSLPCVVAGSSEVYGAPDPRDVPLAESAPLRPTSPYGRSKLGQEEVALAAARDGAATLAATRSFNHTGPGQRAEFVAPALARRVIMARNAREPEIAVGNLDVRRDVGDVRDVVRAYRLILEGLAAGAVPSGSVLNVATGTATSIREILAEIAGIVGFEVVPRPDASLIRPNEPPLIVGDPSLLRRLTGWQPTIPLRQTLADLVASIERTGTPG